MVFTSCTFIFVFFPATVCTYYLLCKKYRNYFLFLASLIFYVWGKPSYIVLLLGSIVVNYLSARFIEHTNNILLRKIELFLALAYNIGLLFVFKYLNFIVLNLNAAFGSEVIQQTSIVLPIGISFYTFQGVSYVIDVFKKNINAQKNIIYFGLYISMFPQLVAGPIVRYTDIASDLADRNISLDDFAEGVQRFIVGFGKKILIADMLGSVADQIFTLGTDELSVAVAWLGAVAYTLQIYFDFSGYSDMAIGLGRIFGFQFNENFKDPYVSKSITEFWRRWHISLSSWFRDYLYIPLGGNRKGNVYVNLFLVFLLTGVWHGASWTFLFWGIWHGVFILVERFLRNYITVSVTKYTNFLRWAYSMLIVVLGWVFFRADTMTYAVGYIKAMFGVADLNFIPFKVTYYLNARIGLILIVACFCSMPIRNRVFDKVIRYFKNQDWVIEAGRCICYLTVFLLAVVSLVSGSYNAFIYFQF
ncbi:MAG: MBOAT family protein [Eubacterium sp.]|nr:MBOAT family protein [Eubacterium sp.]